MKIHREGYRHILVAFVLMLLLLWAAAMLPAPGMPYVLPAYLLPVLLFLWVVWFFRSPLRKIPQDAAGILSPADGKVVVIEKVHEPLYFKGPAIQVSVFMSPLNVHLNRYPVSGSLTWKQYFPGRYLVAWHPKSSTENERNCLAMEDAKGRKLMMQQVAGALARRIVCYGDYGMQVNQGEEMGFIKFGSRVDLFLPVDARIQVHIGQKVKAGITRIAAFE